MPRKGKRKNKKKNSKKALKPQEQQTLPPRHAGKFTSLMKSYEYGQYQKAIKEADKILLEYPCNGETLCLKGLCLVSLKDKEKGESLIKEGLKNNIKSQVCWHTFGLMHRHNFNYPQAIKSLLNALKITKTDTRILSDLAQLQIHQREHDSYYATRRQLLLEKAQQRANWLGFSVGAYLCDELAECIDVIDKWFNTSETKKEGDSENNELLFLQLAAHEKGKTYADALDFIKQNEKFFTNKLDLAKTQAKFLEEVEDFDQAAEIYKSLIRRNPDNENFYQGLLRCKKIETSEVSEILKLYDNYASQNVKADAPRRIPLFVSEGEEFRRRLDEYLRAKFRKIVPSTFNLVKELLDDEKKREIITELLAQYVDQVKNHRRFSEKDPENSESPAVYCWLLYFQSLQCDYLEEHEKSLQILKEAIELSPTCCDFYMQRARIYKHQGNYLEAQKWMNYARSLDKADRYLNTKSCRYCFRAGKFKTGEYTILLFLRSTSGLEAMEDNQVIWYTFYRGLGYTMHKMHKEALTEFERVFNVYEHVYQDQFDFHRYGLRKAAAVTYLHLLEWQNNLRRAPMFVKAAKAAIRTYCRVFDLQSQSIDPASEVKSLPEDNPPPDPVERKLTKERKVYKCYYKTPLKGAVRWVKHLREVLQDDIDTFTLSAGVYRRQAKYLLSFRCLLQGSRLEANNSHLLWETVQFIHDYEEGKIQENVKQHIDILKLLRGQKDARAFVESCLCKLESSLPLLITVLRSQQLFGLNNEETLKLICCCSGILEEACFAFDALVDLDLLSDTHVQHFVSLFPLSSYFTPKETEI